MSSRTINRQLGKLKETGFVKDMGDRYDLVIDSLFTTIHPTTLKYLYTTQNNNTIVTYAFLRAMYSFFQERSKRFFFTKRYLITKVFGQQPSGSAYESFDAILDTLIKLGLVQLARSKKTNEFGEHYVYALVSVRDYIIKEEIPSIESVFGEIDIPDEETILDEVSEYWK